MTNQPSKRTIHVAEGGGYVIVVLGEQRRKSRCYGKEVDLTSLHIFVENIHPFRHVLRQYRSPQAEAQASSKASGVRRSGQKSRLPGGTRVQWVTLLCLSRTFLLTFYLDIWYNKWAGGDREDALARCVYRQTTFIQS